LAALAVSLAGCGGGSSAPATSTPIPTPTVDALATARAVGTAISQIPGPMLVALLAKTPIPAQFLPNGIVSTGTTRPNDRAVDQALNADSIAFSKAVQSGGFNIPANGRWNVSLRFSVLSSNEDAMSELANARSGYRAYGSLLGQYPGAVTVPLGFGIETDDGNALRVVGNVLVSSAVFFSSDNLNPPNLDPGQLAQRLVDAGVAFLVQQISQEIAAGVPGTTTP
jgi:hypothetical protein